VTKENRGEGEAVAEVRKTPAALTCSIGKKGEGGESARGRSLEVEERREGSTGGAQKKRRKRRGSTDAISLYDLAHAERLFGLLKKAGK